MDSIEIEKQEGVAVLRLKREVTNAINLDLLNEFSKILRELKADSSVTGLVLTGTNEKFFSIGFDLPELFIYDNEKMQLFFRTFNRLCLDLFSLPKPTIAALTGHAIAGGCIFTLCCDNRYIADGRKLMGLNEIKLGIPVPYPADCILNQIVGARIAHEIMIGGEFYQAEDLLKMGLVDRVLPIDQVLIKSLEKARSLGELSAEGFGMIKRNRTEMVEKQILSKLDEKEEPFLRLWFSDGVRKLLKEAIKKF